MKPVFQDVTVNTCPACKGKHVDLRAILFRHYEPGGEYRSTFETTCPITGATLSVAAEMQS